MPKDRPNPIYATIAGFCLVATGLCLCRFAYTPLIPSLIDAKWVDRAQAGYLGGFNCLGYIVACVAGVCLPNLIGIRLLMRISTFLAVIGLTMCAWDFGFIWLAIGRFLTGLAGAAFVIHTPSLMLQCIDDKYKSICGGIAFSGAGVCTIVVSLFLPYVLTDGPRYGWLFESSLALVLVIIGWHLVSSASNKRHVSSSVSEPIKRKDRVRLFVLSTAYVLAAIGIVPHTLFLTDYMHRDLGVSASGSSSLFAIFGIGCAVGAMTSGVASKFLGTRLSLSINYLIGSIAVALVLIFSSLIIVTGSAFLIGFFLLQCVPLTSMRTREFVGLNRHPHYWGLLTLAFGFGLLLGSYGMSALLTLGFEYINLFMVAEGALIAGFILILVSWWTCRKVD
mgnify:CR=1 FL=1